MEGFPIVPVRYSILSSYVAPFGRPAVPKATLLLPPLLVAFHRASKVLLEASAVSLVRLAHWPLAPGVVVFSLDCSSLVPFFLVMWVKMLTHQEVFSPHSIVQPGKNTSGHKGILWSVSRRSCCSWTPPGRFLTFERFAKSCGAPICPIVTVILVHTRSVTIVGERLARSMAEAEQPSGRSTLLLESDVFALPICYTVHAWLIMQISFHSELSSVSTHNDRPGHGAATWAFFA